MPMLLCPTTALPTTMSGIASASSQAVSLGA